MFPNYPMMTGQQRRPTGPIYRPQNGLSALGQYGVNDGNRLPGYGQTGYAPPEQAPMLQGGYAPPEQSPQPMNGTLPNEGPPSFSGFHPNEPGAYPQPNQNTGIVPPGFNKPGGNWNFGDANHLPQRPIHPGLAHFMQRWGGGWG